MSDNLFLQINGETQEALRAALRASPLKQFTSCTVDGTKMTFTNKTSLSALNMQVEQAVPQIMDWLGGKPIGGSTLIVPDQPDHDGSNKPGWAIDASKDALEISFEWMEYHK